LLGRGCRNRTYANGFGDHCTTIIRSPHGFIIANPALGGAVLLRFLVRSLFAAVLAIFLHFQAGLGVLLVLTGCVVQVVAHCAFHIDAVIL
jgi:hypothetical protein